MGTGNRGSIYRRGKTWTAMVDLGEQPAQRCGPCGGRARWWVDRAPMAACPKCSEPLADVLERRRESRSGFRRQGDAQTWVTETLGELRDASHVVQSDRATGEFLEEWLTSLRGTVKPSTYASYEMNTRRHLIPAIGSTRLQMLTAARLDGLYRELQDGGRANGTPLSPSTVRLIHVTIRKALQKAVAWGYVARNVADQADPPKPRRPDMTTWSAGELRTFLAAIRDDRYFPGYYLAAMTGMRRGEVLGLRWRDVDLDRGSAHVRQTIVQIGYRLEFGEPKTDRGRRSVALDAQTINVLREQRRHQLEERLAFGPAYQDADLVFATVDGSAIHPDQFSSHFDILVRKSGLPRIRLHDLRHSWASIALHAGVHPKVVQERLGHSSIAVTLDVYSHAIPAMQEEAADQVAALILGG